MNFEELNLAPAIMQAVRELGYDTPTPIQAQAIPAVLAGQDLLAGAQTGTGKTAAFTLPMLHKLSLNEPGQNRFGGKAIRALVLTPTRELAAQVEESVRDYGKYLQLDSTVIFGGVGMNPQINKVKRGVDILVATPGRLLDLQGQGFLDLSTIEILVLDEADRMLALGFMKDIKDVKRVLPRQHQTLFFSATINEEIKALAYSIVRNPIRIQVSPQNMVSRNVTHTVAMIGMDDKRFFLERIIRQHPDSRMLVFVRTRVRAERVQKAMERAGLATAVIHGDKEQADRFAALEAFTKRQVNVLISTDVSARGIDIKQIEYVINYDVPDVAENYVHRVGRTGRGVDKGYAMTFCAEEELPLLKAVEDFIETTIDRVEIPKGDYQDTIDLSVEVKKDFKAIEKMIAENEAFLKKKKGKKK